MVPNVIHLMEVVHVQKAGKVLIVRSEFVPIICLVKIVNPPVNVKRTQQKVVIHSRENAIVMPVGVVIYVIDLVHS